MPPRDSSRPLVRPLLASALVAIVLLVGTSGSELVPILRVLGALIGAAFVVAWFRAVRRDADFVDLATTGALIAFTLSCALSLFPRQAFDAAVLALGLTSGFGVSRRALTTDRMRSYAIFVLCAIGVVLTLVVIALWGAIWLQWLTLTGWRTLPPLDLALPSGPWAHQHDLAILLVMLAPAMWLQRGTGIRRILLLTALAGVAIAVLMDGSRSVWLALAVASGVTAARPASSFVRRHPRLAVAALAGAVTVVVVAITTGAVDEVLRRLTAVRSLDWRAAQWSAALNVWLEHPIQGAGPGSFPFLLRLTDYFDTNAFVSRHPDNAYVQLIAELGVLGLVAGALVVISIARSWHRDGPMADAALWVLIFAFVVGIGMNPFEYGFLLAPLVVWTAIGTPARVDSARSSPAVPRRRWLTPVLASLLGILAIAQSATLLAAFAYDAGSRSAARGSYGEAREQFGTASALDPGMALYRRELGAMALLAGSPGEAIPDLVAATALNPADDVAFRTLAEARLAAGDPAGALSAARSAVQRDAADPRNLIVLARAADRSGQATIATHALTLAILRAPWITADPGWQTLVNFEGDTALLLDAAVAKWLRGASPWLQGVQPAWLAGLAESEEAWDRAVLMAGATGPSAAALLQVLSCDSQPAGLEALRSLERSQGVHGEYWIARVIAEVLGTGAIETELAETASLRLPPIEPAIEDRIPAMDLYSGGFKDQYGYRRMPVEHYGGFVAPSAWGGLAEWINRPAAAALAAGMDGRVASCAP